MKLLFVASEMAPYAKTGGLADVMGALPALPRIARVTTFASSMPLYDTIDTKKTTFEAVGDFDVPLGSHRYQAKIFRVGQRADGLLRPLPRALRPRPALHERRRRAPPLPRALATPR